MQSFHPAVAAWFASAFRAPTPAQMQAWPAIRAGRNVLVAAPTGSGKTLAAFLAAIDDLVRQGVAGTLADATAVVYVSPLKALSNDVRLNLEVPLAGIRIELERMQLPDIEIRTAVRTGDTPQAERAAMRKRPPHIVVTTPESLYILLGSESGRRMLATTRTVIVDEIHALAGNKRGSHLALTLERLDALCGHRCIRVGLSATQKPIEDVARFLVGVASPSFPHPSPPPQAGEGDKLCLPPSAREGARPGAAAFPLPPLAEEGARTGAPSSSLPARAEEGAGTGATSSTLPPLAEEGARPGAGAFPLPPLAGEGARRADGGDLAERGNLADGAACAIIDTGHQRLRDLAIELTPVPLQPVMSNDAWGLVYDRLADLIERHRTTLIFVNTRRTVERATRHLAERLGKDAVAAHHGSLSKEKRLDAERRLKSGELRALVATASLELGIDIGEVDLVCQLASPRSIAAFLQRAGRAGHAVDGVSKARLFPTSRDELVECVALLDAVRRGELDALRIPDAPLDVLAQQIVAEVACGERGEDELFRMFRGAYPYRGLSRQAFTDVVRMLAEGYSTRRGTRAAYLHRDAVNGRLRARRGARMAALTSGGAIPDTADYEVVMQPEALRIGSVHEDFAVESMAGDVFQLGNQSYRVLRVERGRMQVEDAKGATPSVPFWLGEAPGRSDELSRAVSRLRGEIGKRLAVRSPFDTATIRGGDTPKRRAAPDEDWASRYLAAASPTASAAVRCGDTPERCEAPDAGPGPRGLQDCASAVSSHAAPLGMREGSQAGPSCPTSCLDGDGAAARWLIDTVGISEAATRQLVDYLATARIELGMLPTQSTLAMERFFDESGGMQLVIHSPFGSRLNRAWGLALRKRFCRSFNFELQAAATEDAIVLSLSTSHSFPLAEVARYLHSNSVANVLTQALLDAPMFALRFRWNAGAALALPRFAGGRKVPPQIQRMKSEDLLATVFPDQVACLENIVGERRIPDHPLVAQTLDDCLHDAMDLDGLIALLKRMEAGAIRIVARDLTAPSALAAEVLGARPYAFLDGAPLEERRTQAVASRGFMDPERAEDLGRLDADAIAAVREEAWPSPRDADEMHEALLALGAVNDQDLAREPAWQAWLDELEAARRAARSVLLSSPAGTGCRAAANDGSDFRATGNGASSGRSTAASLPEGEGSAAVGALPAGEGRAWWVAAESLPMWRAVHADARCQPAIQPPPEFAAKEWSPEAALVELVRARLGCIGPTSVGALATTFGVTEGDVAGALATLEREGVAMRGHFTPGSEEQHEWCDRALLARIHRRTLQRLRREIEPVTPRDFMRFLLDWQHVAPAARVRGPDGLAAILAQLEGFEVAAGAWEAEVLSARVADYDPAWLDALCGAGRIAWTRLRAPTAATRATPVRASPIVVLPRSGLTVWNAVAEPAKGDAPVLSSRARAVAGFLARRGASFFGEIADGTRLLQVELEGALGELVAQGLAGADSFAGLRALLRPAARRKRPRQRRLARHLLNGIEDAGRWSLTRHADAMVFTGGEDPRPAGREDAPRDRPRAPRASDAAPALGSVPSRAVSDECIEHVARVLLRRWGVVFWKLLQREAAWLPPWRTLRRVFQRFEARGEIRGGRFVDGIVGEQFALPEAVAALRGARKRDAAGELAIVSGTDPLNLAGMVLPGERVPALSGSRIIFRDGLLVATRIAGEVNLQPGALPEDRRAVIARPALPVGIR